MGTVWPFKRLSGLAAHAARRRLLVLIGLAALSCACIRAVHAGEDGTKKEKIDQTICQAAHADLKESFESLQGGFDALKEPLDKFREAMDSWRHAVTSEAQRRGIDGVNELMSDLNENAVNTLIEKGLGETVAKGLEQIQNISGFRLADKANLWEMLKGGDPRRAKAYMYDLSSFDRALRRSGVYEKLETIGIHLEKAKGYIGTAGQLINLVELFNPNGGDDSPTARLKKVREVLNTAKDFCNEIPGIGKVIDFYASAVGAFDDKLTKLDKQLKDVRQGALCGQMGAFEKIRSAFEADAGDADCLTFLSVDDDDPEFPKLLSPLKAWSNVESRDVFLYLDDTQHTVLTGANFARLLRWFTALKSSAVESHRQLVDPEAFAAVALAMGKRNVQTSDFDACFNKLRDPNVVEVLELTGEIVSGTVATSDDRVRYDLRAPRLDEFEALCFFRVDFRNRVKELLAKYGGSIPFSGTIEARDGKTPLDGVELSIDGRSIQAACNGRTCSFKTFVPRNTRFEIRTAAQGFKPDISRMSVRGQLDNVVTIRLSEAPTDTSDSTPSTTGDSIAVVTPSPRPSIAVSPETPHAKPTASPAIAILPSPGNLAIPEQAPSPGPGATPQASPDSVQGLSSPTPGTSTPPPVSSDMPNGYMDNGVYKFKLIAPSAVRYSEIFAIKAIVPTELASQCTDCTWTFECQTANNDTDRDAGSILGQHGSNRTSALGEFQAQLDPVRLLAAKAQRVKVSVHTSNSLAQGEADIETIPESLAVAYPDTWSKAPDRSWAPGASLKLQTHSEDYSSPAELEIGLGQGVDRATVASTGKAFSIGDFRGFLLEDGLSQNGNPTRILGFADKGDVTITVQGRLSGAMGSRDRVRQEYAAIESKNYREMKAIISSIRFAPGGVASSRPAAEAPTSVATEPAKAEELKLKVTVTAERRQILTGETTRIKATVDGADPKDQPLRYTWTGEHEGEGAAVAFSAAKPGKYRLKVDVTSPAGAMATASLDLEVTEAKAEIVKISPAGDTIPVGGHAAFHVKFSGPPGKSYVYRWQPHPEVAFDKLDATTPDVNATFRTPGRVKVWVEVLENREGRQATAAESDQLALEIVKPKLSLVFEPKEPLVGQTVTARIEVDPPDLKEIDFRWEPLAEIARQLGASTDGREITFYSKDARPVEIVARGRVPVSGEDLGEARNTIVAKPYSISVTGPKAFGPKPQEWKGDRLVDVVKAIAVGQTVEFGVDVQPASARSPLTYAWTLTGGSATLINPASRDLHVVANDAGTCALAVTVKDGNGVELGTGNGQFSATTSRETIGKPHQEAPPSSPHLLPPGELWSGVDRVGGLSWGPFVWRVRGDGRSFDLLSADQRTVTTENCGTIVSISNQTIVIGRPQGRYLGTISADRRHISGSFTWAAGSSFTRTILGQPLPAMDSGATGATLDSAPVPSSPSAEQEHTGKLAIAKRLRDEAADHQRKGELSDAIAKFRESLRYVQDDRIVEHIKGLERALAQKVAAARRLMNEAANLQRRGDLAKAIVKYREILRYGPDARIERQIRALEARLEANAGAKRREAKLAHQSQQEADVQTGRPQGEAAQDKHRSAMEAIERVQAEVAQELHGIAESTRERPQNKAPHPGRQATPTIEEFEGEWRGTYEYKGEDAALIFTMKRRSDGEYTAVITMSEGGGKMTTFDPTVVDYSDGRFSAAFAGRTFSGQARRSNNTLTISGNWTLEQLGARGTWTASKDD